MKQQRQNLNTYPFKSIFCALSNEGLYIYVAKITGRQRETFMQHDEDREKH
jgi:hypothetical protein